MVQCSSFTDQTADPRFGALPSLAGVHLDAVPGHQRGPSEEVK